MGRALMRAHPHADAIFFPSPHWPVIEAIEALEREFGVAVMAASQACVWDALRSLPIAARCAVRSGEFARSSISIVSVRSSVAARLQD